MFPDLAATLIPDSLGNVVFSECAKENIQTHGGMGATWEFDCHLFYRRARLLSSNIGSQGIWKDKLITSLEKSNSPT